MVYGSEIEKIARSSRRKLIEEFTEKHTSLAKRVERIPLDEAKQLAESLNCPLQIAKCAYLVAMDGILPVKKAVDLLVYELERRSRVGEGVPNIPSNLLEFALEECKWIEFIYGSFARDLESKTRGLANLEAAFETESVTAEQALIVIRERTKIAEGIITPILTTWFNDHDYATSLDALLAFGPALTNWPRATFQGKIPRARRRTQAFFRKLISILSTVPDSAVASSASERLNLLLEDLSKELKTINPIAIAHLLLHVAPRPIGRGDKSAYVIIGAASTRGNKIEPDMSTPFDFLERDIHLGKRRWGEERKEYLKERISRVLKVLQYQEMTLEQIIRKTIEEISQRFQVNRNRIDIFIETKIDELRDTSIELQDELTSQTIFQFIEEWVYGDVH